MRPLRATILYTCDQGDVAQRRQHCISAKLGHRLEMSLGGTLRCEDCPTSAVPSPLLHASSILYPIQLGSRVPELSVTVECVAGMARIRYLEDEDEGRGEDGRESDGHLPRELELPTAQHQACTTTTAQTC